MNGRISSFQSMGAVDGPGLRCAVFMQGCPLRCAYCHNPETWESRGGDEVAAETLVQKILRYKNYIQKTGGVTLSGGEPLLQWQFAAELLGRLKKNGIHTALDTSGIGDLAGAEEVLKVTDLVLCDIKFTDEADFKNYCGGELSQVYDFLGMTNSMNIPLWIRQVIVPGINDTAESVKRLKERAALYRPEKIQLLPFRKLCEAKYESLGIEFRLKNVPECGKETIDSLRKLL